MSSLNEAFKARKALITFITAGDPSLGATEKLVAELAKAGADIIELGIPFSDPLADGPVIQASHQRALRHNVSLSDVFKLVRKIRHRLAIPICLMLSYNLVVHYGQEKFYADCAKAGIDGVIIPDLSPVNSRRLAPSEAEGSPVETIYLVAPTSSEARIKMIAEQSRGFIYLVSTTGITGPRSELAAGLKELVGRIRKYSRLPIAIGFGISTPAQAAAAAKVADGVIVGSAIVDLIGQKRLTAVPKFVASLRRALDH